MILAPNGRDAAVASGLLREVGIAARCCANVAALEQSVQEDCCFLVIAEEAVLTADLRGIVGCLERQPPWSDLPVIVLSRSGRSADLDAAAVRLAEILRNVTFLERPFHPATFASVARTALKSRLRQYEARGRVEQLHESEERLRTALVAGRLGSWELNLVKRRVTASETCKAQFGRAADAPFTYDDLLGALHPKDRPKMVDALQATLESGRDLAAECRTLWPDGSTHWAEIRARLVRDRDGGNPRLVGVCSDITERKQAEVQLLRMNELLEERVAVRTAELSAAHAARLSEIEQRENAERKLRHAQKMETIGQLTGGVAHDFNNLLMAVLGNLELLRKRVPSDPKTARLIEGALQGAQRGAALTQRLLAFAHRQELKVEPCDLVALLQGMADLIENSIGSQIDLTLQLPSTPVLALADANQVELAVLNLVVNARDAMPDGGSLVVAIDEVEESAGEGTTPRRYMRIVVEDSGHGMDLETLRKATEPFFSTKELGKGTGLGLSMIHGLAVQLQGQLRLTSEVDRGTRAELLLPPADAAAPPSEARPVAPAQPERSVKATILVVDDDTLILMSTVDMLEDLGHRVIDASSGLAALEVIRSGQPIDLLITDYAMPRMNGGKLAEAARALRPDLPMLLATGYAELPPGSTLDLPRISKPYQQEQLAAVIDGLLQEARTAGGQPRAGRSGDTGPQSAAAGPLRDRDGALSL